MSWFGDNYLWKFYPNLKWQLVLMYLLGIAIFYRFMLEFTILFIIIVGFYIYFFRIPPPLRKSSQTIQICNIDGTCRTIASNAFSDPKEILSPAFGKVKDIKMFKGNYIISIEMNIFDYHSQYAPVSGRVDEIIYTQGEFKINKDDKNENQLIVITNKKGRIGVRQIAGIITRRIRTTLKEQQNIDKGDYIGFIELGSQVDLYIPISNTVLFVKKGDLVEGYKTSVAKWLT